MLSSSQLYHPVRLILIRGKLSTISNIAPVIPNAHLYKIIYFHSIKLIKNRLYKCTIVKESLLITFTKGNNVILKIYLVISDINGSLSDSLYISPKYPSCHQSINAPKVVSLTGIPF